MSELVYARAFFLDQREGGRTTGTLLEESTEQVRVEVTEADLILLQADAKARCSFEACPDTALRLAARNTLVKVRMARAQLRPGRYSEKD